MAHKSKVLEMKREVSKKAEALECGIETAPDSRQTEEMRLQLYAKRSKGKHLQYEFFETINFPHFTSRNRQLVPFFSLNVNWYEN